MVRIIEAIYADGVLKPTERLDFREQQRVRLTVEAVEQQTETSRQQAVERFRAGVASTSFCSNGPYPTREELHERR